MSPARTENPSVQAVDTLPTSSLRPSCVMRQASTTSSSPASGRSSTTAASRGRSMPSGRWPSARRYRRSRDRRARPTQTRPPSAPSAPARHAGGVIPARTTSTPPPAQEARNPCARAARCRRRSSRARGASTDGPAQAARAAPPELPSFVQWTGHFQLERMTRASATITVIEQLHGVAPDRNGQRSLERRRTSQRHLDHAAATGRANMGCEAPGGVAAVGGAGRTRSFWKIARVAAIEPVAHIGRLEAVFDQREHGTSEGSSVPPAKLSWNGTEIDLYPSSAAPRTRLPDRHREAPRRDRPGPRLRLRDTGATQSAIAYIDGDAGILRYRGYDIEALADQEHPSFLETTYLLIYGELPLAASTTI